MKLVIDEKLKHRLIGMAVIISLGAIFAPAMMKKSSQTMDTNYSVRVKLPVKPEEPSIAIADGKEVFKTIKLARVNVPPVSEESQLPGIAKADVLHEELVTLNELPSLGRNESSSSLEPVQLALDKAAKNTVKAATQIALRTVEPEVKPTVLSSTTKLKQMKRAKPIVASSSQKTPAKHSVNVVSKSVIYHSAVRKTPVRGPVYAVQLASFSRLANAQALVNRLHRKGYKASYIRVATKSGISYKVYAGHSPRKTEAVRLKTQLANAMQLDGFVVNTGVS